MPFSDHGPNGCLQLYQPNRGLYGFPKDLFICTHGGWDGKTMCVVPSPRGQLYFWGYHGDTITGQVCCQIMSARHNHKVKSIAGSGALVWNYSLTEYRDDWSGATTAVTEAFNRSYSNRYDCVMVDDKMKQGRTIFLSDVFAAFPDYPRYHLMACRVEDGVPRSETERVSREQWKKSLDKLT